jgi:hypothetical protein
MMWPFEATKPVAEYDASDEIEELYHDIRQTLRVTGVNLLFRALAGYSNALPVIWQALHPVVSMRDFEQAADLVRAKAVALASAMDPVGAAKSITLGPSQAYQVQKALALYHYINPKLLVMVSALRSALEDQKEASDRQGRGLFAGTVPRGEPSGMYPMDMVSEEPDDEQVAVLFKEITDRYALSSINSDYRTLALWPDYLEAAWRSLRRCSRTSVYDHAIQALQEDVRAQVQSLPVVALPRVEFEERIPDAAAVKEKIANFERILPPLILNVALMSLDWHPTEILIPSPFPLGAV